MPYVVLLVQHKAAPQTGHTGGKCAKNNQRLLSRVVAPKGRGPPYSGFAVRQALSSFLAVLWVGAWLAALRAGGSGAVVKGADGAWLRLRGRSSLLLAEKPCLGFRQWRAQQHIMHNSEYEAHLTGMRCRCRATIDQIAMSSNQRDKARQIRAHCLGSNGLLDTAAR
jgi:hypothetical protein